MMIFTKNSLNVTKLINVSYFYLEGYRSLLCFGLESSMYVKSNILTSSEMLKMLFERCFKTALTR